MQKVYLTGDLAKFGSCWEVECNTLSDIIRLISCQEPEFKTCLVEAQEAGLGLELIKGKKAVESEVEFLISLNNEDIILSLVPGGSKKYVTVVLGITLFLATGGMAVVTAGSWSAAATAFGSLGLPALIGLNIAVAGLAALLAPGPETDIDTNKDETPGANLFNGPVNTTKQNVPIPILYGELIVGGATINGGFLLDDTELPQSTKDSSGYASNQLKLKKVAKIAARAL